MRACWHLPFKVKNKLLHLPTQERGTALLDFGGSIFLIFLCYSGPLTQWPPKLLTLIESQNNRRFGNRSKLLNKIICHVRQKIQQNQWYLKCQWQIMLFASLAGSYRWITGHTVRILEQHPTILYDYYSLFEKQLLACYWALVETECLTIGHQVIMRCELPIMNRLWSDTPTHNVGTHRRTPLSNGSFLFFFKFNPIISIIF